MKPSAVYIVCVAVGIPSCNFTSSSNLQFFFTAMALETLLRICVCSLLAPCNYWLALHRDLAVACANSIFTLKYDIVTLGKCKML